MLAVGQMGGVGEAVKAEEAEEGVETEFVETSNNQDPVALAQNACSPTI
jgi:hypothetical protein